MPLRSDKDISALMREGTEVDAALARGVREAMIRHYQAGQSAVEWRDGKCVWLTPEEIKIRIEEMDKKK